MTERQAWWFSFSVTDAIVQQDGPPSVQKADAHLGLYINLLHCLKKTNDWFCFADIAH